MSIGGPCAVEGCKGKHMFNSSVCFKHKESKERHPKQQTETKHYPYPKRNWLELLCVIYLLPAVILNFTGSHNTDLGAFGRIYMSGLFICFLILFILSRDEDYRHHSLFMRPKDEESQSKPKRPAPWTAEKDANDSIDWGAVFFPPKTETETSIDSIREKQQQGNKLSPSERQAFMSAKCSMPGCNSANFRMTDYCYKHRDHVSLNSEPETEEEENWWEDEKE